MATNSRRRVVPASKMLATLAPLLSDKPPKPCFCVFISPPPGGSAAGVPFRGIAAGLQHCLAVSRSSLELKGNGVEEV